MTEYASVAKIESVDGCGCHCDERCTDECVTGETCCCMHQEQVDALRQHEHYERLVALTHHCFEPPLSAWSWHGGPAHVQLDDWNLDMDVPETWAEENYNFGSGPKMREYLARLKAFYEPPSTFPEFAKLWNLCDEDLRCVVVADVEHQIMQRERGSR